MKRALLALSAAAVLLTAGVGCQNMGQHSCRGCKAPRGCKDGACVDGSCEDGSCGRGGCRTCGGLFARRQARAAAAGAEEYGMAGPPAPQVTYPYYTTRGPRDFLLDNPPTIGP